MPVGWIRPWWWAARPRPWEARTRVSDRAISWWWNPTKATARFLKLSPILAVVTNIDREHLDHYPSIGEIRAAFLEFIQKVPFYGAAILCLDDENIQQLLPSVNRRIDHLRQEPASQPANLRTSTAALSRAASRCGRAAVTLGTFHLRVPGVHNVLNATAAIAVGLELDIPLESIRDAIASYSGVDRRFQMRGQARGVTVIDDYGHHPTEIRATLAAAQLCKFQRVLAVFQPHRYTRTQHLMDEFAKSFHQADLVFVLDIYAASESADRGHHRPARWPIAFAISDTAASQYTGTHRSNRGRRARKVRDQDVVLTLGAGNVWQVGDRGSGEAQGGGLNGLASSKTKSKRPQRRCRHRCCCASPASRSAVGVVLSGGIYASERFAQFLIRDPRFFLAGPVDYGLESPNLELHGIQYASRQQVLRLFEPDYGRSLYLFPLDRAPQANSCASDGCTTHPIARIWPNRIVVQITERKPAAFIKLPAEAMLRWALIDDEGVILDPPRKAALSASRPGRRDGRRDPAKARHSRAPHAAADERTGADGRQRVRSGRERSGRFENHRAGRRRRRDLDARRSQFFLAPQEFPGALSRTSIGTCRRPRPSTCGSMIASPAWRRRAMSDKPQIAAGLDLGSSSTRCLILLLEDGRLRYAGHSEVPSDGWAKGKLADQQAVTTCRACRGARSRGTSARFRGCPRGWYGRRAVSTDAIAAGSTNSPGRARSRIDDMAYAVERSEQVRLEEDRMILHLFPQDFTLDGRSGKRYPRGSICSRLEANVHIVTCSEQEHHAVLHAVQQASYAVEESMFEPVATAYAAVNRDDRNRGVAVVDIGKHSTDLVVYDGEAVLLARSLRDISRSLHARRGRGADGSI